MTEKILGVDIRTDGGTQPRVGIDMEVVREYAEAMNQGATFPPVTVYYDGSKYWLADGFHRVKAAFLAAEGKPALDKRSIKIEAEVLQGTRRDAILHSVGANAQHGLRRTNADKRRSVLTLLRDDDWQQWSDREIARRCGVHWDTVGKIRKEMSPSETDSEHKSIHPEQRTYTTKHGTTATMNTTNIGKQKPSPPPVVDSWEAPEPSPPVKPLVDLGGIDPSLYTRATKVGGALTRLAEITQFNPTETATGFKDHEKPRAVGNARVILDWLEQFVQAMESV